MDLSAMLAQIERPRAAPKRRPSSASPRIDIARLLRQVEAPAPTRHARGRGRGRKAVVERGESTPPRILPSEQAGPLPQGHVRSQIGSLTPLLPMVRKMLKAVLEGSEAPIRRTLGGGSQVAMTWKHYVLGRDVRGQTYVSDGTMAFPAELDDATVARMQATTDFVRPKGFQRWPIPTAQALAKTSLLDVAFVEFPPDGMKDGMLMAGLAPHSSGQRQLEPTMWVDAARLALATVAVGGAPIALYAAPVPLGEPDAAFVVGPRGVAVVMPVKYDSPAQQQGSRSWWSW